MPSLGHAKVTAAALLKAGKEEWHGPDGLTRTQLSSNGDPTSTLGSYTSSIIHKPIDLVRLVP